MGRIYTFDVPDMPQELASQVERFLTKERIAGTKIATENVSSFSNWFERKNPSLYIKVKPYIEKLFEAIKDLGEGLKAFGEGVLKTYVSVAATPVVAVYEGVKEGFNNGLEAGVNKAIKEGKKFLKDLWGD